MRVFDPIPAMIAVSFLALTPTGAAASPSDFAGIWSAKTHKPRLLPADGKAIPFSPAGRAQYGQTVRDLKKGDIVDQGKFLCLPLGVPRALTSALPFQIMVTPKIIVFAHEENRAYRTVNVAARHADPETWDPSFMGDGIARWEGEMLVIDSTNFKSDKIYLDDTGLPASEKLHLIERIHLVSNGSELEDIVTIDDPGMYARPWSVRLVFDRHDKMRLKTDWVCGQGHRDLSSPARSAAR